MWAGSILSRSSIISTTSFVGFLFLYSRMMSQINCEIVSNSYIEPFSESNWVIYDSYVSSSDLNCFLYVAIVFSKLADSVFNFDVSLS